MELIKDTHYEGERPLFATHNLHLENVTIHTGESALKECSNIDSIWCTSIYIYKLKKGKLK